MRCYNHKGEIVDIELGLSINYGQCSSIYNSGNDIAFKRYFEYTSKNARMNYEIYNILKKLNHPHTNRILELDYDIYNIDKLDDLMNR